MEGLMKLLDVILKAMGRNLQRKRQAFQAFGYTELFDQWRGKRSIHTVPMEMAERILALYQEKYFDCNVRLNYSWLKTGAIRSGLVARRMKRGLYRRTEPATADAGDDVAYRWQPASVVSGRSLLRSDPISGATGGTEKELMDNAVDRPHTRGCGKNSASDSLLDLDVFLIVVSFS
jgi:hypothetical protein